MHKRSHTRREVSGRFRVLAVCLAMYEIWVHHVPTRGNVPSIQNRRLKHQMTVTLKYDGISVRIRHITLQDNTQVYRCYCRRH